MIYIDKLIELSIEEDVGLGDITTDSIIDPLQVSKAEIIAKEALCLCGVKIAKQIFHKIDTSLEIEIFHEDGELLKSQELVMSIRGITSSILKGERIVLNFLQRLSGIASQTNKYAEIAKKYNVKVCDTRKTTPGHRLLEKYAVKCGGGSNHRMSLADSVLIKDNHIKASGSIKEAVFMAKENIPHTSKIEVEVQDLEQIKEALDCGVDIIMLDNMSPFKIKEAVDFIEGRVTIEVSGGVNWSNFKSYAGTGVDIISIGALTHSFRSVDLSLNLDISSTL